MYAIYGSDESIDVIIAIPALGERKEMFQPLANQMTNYKWIVFDLPGSNKQVLEAYSIKLLCNEIKQTLDSLHIKKAHFIGSSLGAWAIQAYTALFPEYVRSLTLLDGGHYFLGERNEIHEDVELPSAIENFEDIRLAVKDLTYSMPNLESQAYTNFENYFLNNYIRQENGYAHHCNEKAYNTLSEEITSVDYCLKHSTIPMHLLIAEAVADEFSIEKSLVFSTTYEQALVTKIEFGQHYLPLTNTLAVSKALEEYYYVKSSHSLAR